MITRYGIAIAILGLMTPLVAYAEEKVNVSGRVVDAAGKPVSRADVATFWEAKNGEMTPHEGATTNAEGRFTLTIEFSVPALGLLALDKERKTGGLVMLGEKSASKPVEINLVPLVHIHGQFFCKELKKRPKWTNVYVMIGEARILYGSSTEASFSFSLPPNIYKFVGYGTDIQVVKKDLTLKADEPDLDLKTIDAPATILARHVGKAPPAWHVADARGVKKDVKLSDFKGKWVLIEFWGYW